MSPIVTNIHFLRVYLLTLALAAVCGVPVNAGVFSVPPLVVDLGYAKYQGIPFVDSVSNTTNTNFLGLRYASPPIGALRFAAPQLPAKTPGIQIADTQPNMCYQANFGMQPTNPFPVSARAVDAATAAADEDCLFLNVFVPGHLGAKKDLPVIVYIHGGGYVFGSASAGYNGNDLIRESGGEVVVVVLQYRLGVFGFLAGQKVKDGGALNAGLLDQQFALQWVQKYISTFGGDPAKVTLWGWSAGAGSIVQHLVANGGRTEPPLFRSGMTSSTFLPSQYLFNDSIPETLYATVISQTNCSDEADTLGCLRRVDVDTLQAANVDINNNGFFGTFVFVPVIDGTFITDRPMQLLKQKKLNADVFFSVTNTFEGTLIVDQNSTDSVPQYVAKLFPKFGPTEVAAAASTYAGLGSTLFQLDAIMGESILICPTYFLLERFGPSSFKGEFAIPPGLHGDDLPYYFPSMNANGIPPFPDPAFSKAFSESFLNFAKTLDPNIKSDHSDITPPWKRWNGSNEILFNRTESGAVDIRQIKTSRGLLERCEFWRSVGALTGQ